MNLFATEDCPKQSARWLDDKRVGKLLMEANQMLSLAVKVHHTEDPVFLQIGPGQLCSGMAHRNHPVSIWVRETRGNFDWCYQHAIALGDEWSYRFGREHASAPRSRFIYGRYAHFVPNGPLQPFQNSARNIGMGVDFSHVTPVTAAYRMYLAERWRGDARPPVWTKRRRPQWA